MKNFNSIYSNEENESHELNFKAEKSCTEKRCEVISINVEVNDNDTKRKCRTSTAYRIKPVISSFAHFIRIICFVFRFFFEFGDSITTPIYLCCLFRVFANHVKQFSIGVAHYIQIND